MSLCAYLESGKVMRSCGISHTTAIGTWVGVPRVSVAVVGGAAVWRSHCLGCCRQAAHLTAASRGAAPTLGATSSRMAEAPTLWNSRVLHGC